MGLLQYRLKNGKEDADRLSERFGMPSLDRPDGPLLWVHVASVGEAQSMLYIINLFLKQNLSASVLVTSITKTSAALLEKRLPQRAFHQYLPVDRPKWVKRFLKYWNPSLILWAESELWPTIISEIGKSHLPMALINGRMSNKSYKNWSRAKGMIENILSSFTVIMTQTDKDKNYFLSLGARSVVTTGNIKFAANPLPVDPQDLDVLKLAILGRPLWVYASTHAGEEELAAETHISLLEKFPDLLTIIIPRHPERRNQICSALQSYQLSVTLRSEQKILPDSQTDIYLVDSLGELGLFYTLSPLSVIGRSFSKDGGGGHNPLEAAQLGSAVFHGPHIQNLQDIYLPMDAQKAAYCIDSPEKLPTVLKEYLSDKEALKKLSEKGYSFAESQKTILTQVIEECEPIFLLAELPLLKA